MSTHREQCVKLLLEVGIHAPEKYDDLVKDLLAHNDTVFYTLPRALQDLLDDEFKFSLFDLSFIPTEDEIAARAKVESTPLSVLPPEVVVGPGIASSSTVINNMHYAFYKYKGKPEWDMIKAVLAHAEKCHWNKTRFVHELLNMRVVAAAVQGEFLITKFPDAATDDDFAAFAPTAVLDAKEVGPTSVYRELKDCSLTWVHRDYTYALLGTEEVRYVREVTSDEDIKNTQRILDFIQAKIEGRPLKYRDTPGLTQAKRMFLTRYQLIGGEGTWEYQIKPTPPGPHHPFVMRGMVDLKRALEDHVRPMNTRDQVLNAMDLWLIEEKTKRAATLFQVANRWVEVEGPTAFKEIAKDLLRHPFTTVAQCHQAYLDQKNNRELRNLPDLEYYYHHNATFRHKCQDFSDSADHVIPVIDKVLEAKVIQNMDRVFIQTESDNTVRQYLGSKGASVVNHTTSGCTKIADIAPTIVDGDTVIYDAEAAIRDADGKVTWGTIGVLKELHALKANPSTIVLRIDLRKIPLASAEAAFWDTTIQAYANLYGFNKFAIFKAGRYHTPIVHLIATRVVTDAKWRPSLSAYFENVAMEAFSVANYCETLIQRAYELSIRPDLKSYMKATVVGPGRKYTVNFLEPRGEVRTMCVRVRAHTLKTAVALVAKRDVLAEEGGFES